jgi:hypothetical protein
MKNKELFEKLADIEHQRWAHWQKYLHSRCTNLNGSLIMSPKYVRHLERQIDTPYSELSEREKDMDRQEVMRYWGLIK